MLRWLPPKTSILALEKGNSFLVTGRTTSVLLDVLTSGICPRVIELQPGRDGLQRCSKYSADVFIRTGSTSTLRLVCCTAKVSPPSRACSRRDETASCGQISDGHEMTSMLIEVLCRLKKAQSTYNRMNVCVCVCGCVGGWHAQVGSPWIDWSKPDLTYCAAVAVRAE